MTTYVMVVQSHAPNPEVDATEYDAWYEHIHIPEVLQLPEFVSAQRFKVAALVSGELVHSYLTHYEIEADSAEAARDALVGAAVSGKFNMLKDLDTSTMVTAVYEPLTDRKTKPQAMK